MSTRRAKPHAKVKSARRVLSPDEAWAEALVARMLSACHPWQVDAVEDPHRRVSMLVGRGGGKTTALRVRGVKKCVRKRKAKVLYFAKTRLHAKDLMWHPLKDLCDNLGLEVGKDVAFNETELRCTFLRTGSVYQLSGMDDLGEIEKWRGQSFDEVQIDEGASHKAELLDVLMYRVVGPRLGDRDGVIVMAGSAGHILMGTFYDVTRTGSDKHRPYSDRETAPRAAWSSHWWTLEMVCELPDARTRFPALVKLWDEALIEFAENLWGPDNPVRKREYGAMWAADNTTTIFQYRARLDDGTPWNEWDPEMVERGPDRVLIARLPPGPDGQERTDWLYALTMDHGASDAFALNVFAASPSDPKREILHIFCFEQTHMYAQRIAILMIGPRVMTNLDAAHADPGGVIGALGEWPTGMESDVAALGQNILDELSQVYGIKVLPAEQKGKLSNIELVNGDLVEGRLKILKGSALASQVTQLQWVRDEYGFPKENKAQANHCLAGGTMVMTERGERPIESVAAGDWVWTRAGLRRVTFSGRTGVATTIERDLGNGRSIRGTADHRVFANGIWIPLGLLTPSNTLLEWENMDRPRSLYSQAGSTDDIHAGPTSAWLGTSRPLMGSSFIALSGRQRTDLFQRGCMSIIATAITATTHSRTSRPSTAESTSACTVASPSAPPSRRTGFGDSPSRPPLYGTALRTGSRGTEDMRITRYIASWCVNAMSAAPNSFPGPHEGSAAARTASASRTTRGCARTEPVFDLSVEDEHEFFANGVLVSNSSDCMVYGRKLLGRLFDSAKDDPPPLKQQRDARPREPQHDFAARLQPKGEFDGLFQDDYSRFGI